MKMKFSHFLQEIRTYQVSLQRCVFFLLSEDVQEQLVLDVSQQGVHQLIHDGHGHKVLDDLVSDSHVVDHHAFEASGLLLYCLALQNLLFIRLLFLVL